MGGFSKSPRHASSHGFFSGVKGKDFCACQGVWLKVKVITVEVQSSCILVCCHISILLFTCTSRLYWDVLDYNLNVIWVIPPSNSAQNMFFLQRLYKFMNLPKSTSTCGEESDIFWRILMNEQSLKVMLFLYVYSIFLSTATVGGRLLLSMDKIRLTTWDV